MIVRSPGWREIGEAVGPCIRPGGAILTERALEICNLPSGSRVVDVGCGAGGTLECLKRTGLHGAVGLDYSETLLKEAALRLASPRLARGRAEALPFKTSSLDALFCECVLSILSDREGALNECSRVLKNGGFLVVSDVFDEISVGEVHNKTELEETNPNGILEKEDFLGSLTWLGFSLLLWEEHGSLLREFVARMIFAGHSLPDPWGCAQRRPGRRGNRGGISYFLLVARRSGDLSAKSETRETTNRE
jgi:arsenite methyltransferase